MNDEGSKLIESLMSMLGDNPSEKVGQMLSALTQNADAQPPKTEAAADEKEEAQTETKSEEKEKHTAEESGSSGGFDPAMLFKLQAIMSQLGSCEADERSALLTAIRPFLSEERRPQIDQAIKLLKLTKLAKTAQEMDLFNGLL